MGEKRKGINWVHYRQEHYASAAAYVNPHANRKGIRDEKEAKRTPTPLMSSTDFYRTVIASLCSDRWNTRIGTLLLLKPKFVVLYFSPVHARVSFILTTSLIPTCVFAPSDFRPARVMGFEEAQRHENLRDIRDTIGRIHRGVELGSCVMFFGDKYVVAWECIFFIPSLFCPQVCTPSFVSGSADALVRRSTPSLFRSTVSIQPVQRIEPHVSVGRSSHDELFREWIWKASISDRASRRKRAFGGIVQERFDRAFDVSREWAEARRRSSCVDVTAQSLIVLDGAVDDGAPPQNGYLPAGSLLWCSLSNSPAWPCRVVSINRDLYRKLRKEGAANGDKDASEPVVFFGDDSLTEPQAPMLASLNALSVFLSTRHWVEHFRQRSIRLAETANPPVDTSDWNNSLWTKWDVAVEMAEECATTGDVSAIYRWLAVPGSPQPSNGSRDPCFMQVGGVDKQLSAPSRLGRNQPRVLDANGRKRAQAPGSPGDSFRDTFETASTAGEQLVDDDDDADGDEEHSSLSNGASEHDICDLGHRLRLGTPMTHVEPSTGAARAVIRRKRKRKLDWAGSGKKTSKHTPALTPPGDAVFVAANGVLQVRRGDPDRERPRNGTVRTASTPLRNEGVNTFAAVTNAAAAPAAAAAAAAADNDDKSNEDDNGGVDGWDSASSIGNDENNQCELANGLPVVELLTHSEPQAGAAPAVIQKRRRKRKLDWSGRGGKKKSTNGPAVGRPGEAVFLAKRNVGQRRTGHVGLKGSARDRTQTESDAGRNQGAVMSEPLCESSGERTVAAKSRLSRGLSRRERAMVTGMGSSGESSRLKLADVDTAGRWAGDAQRSLITLKPGTGPTLSAGGDKPPRDRRASLRLRQRAARGRLGDGVAPSLARGLGVREDMKEEGETLNTKDANVSRATLKTHQTLAVCCKTSSACRACLDGSPVGRVSFGELEAQGIADVYEELGV